LDDSSDKDVTPKKASREAWHPITGGLNAFVNVRNPENCKMESQLNQVDPWAGKSLPIKRKKDDEKLTCRLKTLTSNQTALQAWTSMTHRRKESWILPSSTS
jgi:hypothetical protein